MDGVEFLSGQYEPLESWGITEETCRRYGYQVGEWNHNGRVKKVQIAPYYDAEGTLVAQKIRFPNKEFTVIGDLKKATLYGQKVWHPGRRVVITEGERDTLAASQAQGNKWQVVSVPNGAAGAKKALAAQLEWLLKFEEVVLMFDMDEPGQKAAKECAELFPAGKCKIAKLSMKDASDVLKAGNADEIVKAIWNAEAFRPDGIVTFDDIIEKAMRKPEPGLPWFLPTLTRQTYGRRYGEVYTFGAGTGVGKTDFLTQQIAFDIVELKLSVGVVFMEQDNAETAQRIAGKSVGKLFHIPELAYDENDLRDALLKVKSSAPVMFYDNWGVCDWEVVRAKIRYMHHAAGIRVFYVDHLTAMAAESDDEKKSLERIMAQIAGLAKELNCIIHLVSHLSTPDGKPHEEGGRVMIRHFKGSRAIGFWSHFMFGIERSQQDPNEKNQSTLRVLKDRYTGRSTGLTIPMRYDADTGLISEGEALFEPVDEGDF